MKHYFRSIVLFCCIGICACAQTGKLAITLYPMNFGKTDSIALELIGKDGKTEYKTSFGESDYILTAPIKTGEYELVIMVNGKLNASYSGIKIDSGMTNNIDVTATDQRMSDSKEDSVTNGKLEAALFMLYGPKLEETDSAHPLNDTYKFGFVQMNYFTNLRYYSPGIGYGFNLALTRFNKGMGIDSIAYKHERYFALNFSFAFMNRFTFFDNSKVDRSGTFLDIGATYELPVLFREVQSDGNNKLVHRGIHQYTDVNAIVRLGYEHVSLTAEYRVLDFILGNYPEIPPLTLGLSILIPND